MLQAADVSLLELVVPWHAPWLDTILATISAAGSGGAIWMALAILGLSNPKWRAGAWRLLLAIGLALALNNLILKPLVARPRPTMTSRVERHLPSSPSSYSFPSGHTASSVAAAMLLARLWPAGRAAWWSLAALMAYSRLYLGHHYPVDVLAGAVVGMLVAYWVLGGRHPATDARTLPKLASGTVVRP